MKTHKLSIAALIVLSFTIPLSAITITTEDHLYLSSKCLTSSKAKPAIFVKFADEKLMQFNIGDNAVFFDSVEHICSILSNREHARCEVQLATEEGYVKSFRINYPNIDSGTFLELELDNTDICLLLDNSQSKVRRISHAKDPDKFNSVMDSSAKLLRAGLIEDKYGLVTLPAGSYVDQRGYRFTLDSFAISNHEISRGLWTKVANWSRSKGYSPFPTGPADDKLKLSVPHEDTIMTSMTWFEAVRWCNAYSQMSGLSPVYINKSTGKVYRVGEEADIEINESANGFRLPTEAQWEYACRAGTTTEFFWGDKTSSDIVNKYLCWVANSGGKVPLVASKKPNAFGLYDMHGGAWEWCFDSDVGPYKVTRGSSYLHWLGDGSSSANHYPHVAGARESYIGFRLARKLQ